MKRNNPYFLIPVLALFLFSQASFAQADKNDLEQFQARFGTAKKDMISSFLKIDSNNAFWPIYNEYETKRQEQGKQRLQALTNYVNNYDKMDDATYDNTIKQMIQLRDGHDKLLDEYYSKIKKASGSKVASQFFQIETYIQSAIRVGIMEGIPFIGELELK